MNRLAALALLCSMTVGVAAGCGEEVVLRGVKRVEEKVSPEEFESFQSIIESLPEKKLPPIPSTLLPRPHWTQERTLPIQDLVRQENDAFEERWSVDIITRQLPKSKKLQRALRREHMTPEQFVGLALAIGAACTADAVDPRIDLPKVVEGGKRHVDALSADETAFSTLSDERAHEILVQAAWITVVNRARILMKVPPENLMLVRKHREWLNAAFPDHLTRDPLAELTNVMQHRGIPFEEMPESGSDEDIEWNMKTAIIGDIRTEEAR